MPVYNGARTLREAVDSILSQTYRDFELIICNDASIDTTSNVLKSITDDRVYIIQNEINLGPGPSRDRAIEIARGQWIAFIDADDTWVPERLETLLIVADSKQNAMIFDDIMECHDTPLGMIPWRALRGEYAFSENSLNVIEVPLESYICSKRLLIKPFLPTAFIEKNHIRHNSRPDSKEPVEDSEFFLKLMFLGLRLIYVPKAMYYYRITPGSAISQIKRITIMREIFEDIADKSNYEPKIQDALRKKIIMLKRDEQYMPFILSLKRKELITAFQLAFRSPWITIDFFRRLGHSLDYQVHRIWHGGRSRGVR
jgi:succinoglycan biosynthesis protein ExoO